MEDFVVGSESSVMDTDKLTSMLRKESSFFMGIQRLTDTLEHLDRFLEAADAKSVEEVLRECVKSWSEERREAKEVDQRYLEEECFLNFSQFLQQRRVINFLGRAGRRLNRLNANQSNEALPIGVNENDQMREEVHVSSRTSNVRKKNRKIFLSCTEEYVDSAAKDLTAWLIEGGAPKWSILSLVGPNGIGKTTLAKKLYNSQIIRQHFDCFSWINVSKTYELKEVLKAMIEQSDQERQQGELFLGMRAMELFGTLRQLLKQKRYFFVFDDVYHEEFWHVIKQGLLDDEKGSRIIITTTSDKIVDCCKLGSSDYVHRLGPLSEAMSWKLFCRIAFQDEPEQHCPKELEKSSQEIIRMCKGFPLPIVAMADLLSTKDKVMSECQKMLSYFVLEFKFNPSPPGVLDVLTLSFLDLPNHLRSCFLYFSIFPKDMLIPKDKLFKLWIAESFVEAKKRTTLEEVAETYLNELIQRNMVQACQGYGLEKFCQVHSLIHDMARAKAHELNFCLVLDDNSLNYGKNSIRLSIYNIQNVLRTINDTHVRSVFLFNDVTLPNSFLVSLVQKCELLALLDLEYVPIDSLPEVVGDLLNLKYLCLKNTRVSSLPISLHKLRRLQTLDVRNTLLFELPIDINILKNLQHILASVYDNRISGESSRGVRTKGEIGYLENLQTLTTVEANNRGVGLFEQLKKLQQLRNLGISGLRREFGTALCTAIDQLIHLKYLTLQVWNKKEVLNVQTISSSLPLLRHLVLKGQLQRLPYWISGLQNLTTLCLSLSKLTLDPLMHLSQLPNLASLWLCRAFEGEQLYFAEGSFQRLKQLVLRDLEGLNVLEIEKGSLPRLEEMRIGSSPLLNEVPSGIRHLGNLKVLANYDMPSEFVQSIQPSGGSDHAKVSHIPSVLFLYKVKVYGTSYKLYKLGDSDLMDHLQGLATNREANQHYENEFELSFCESDDEEEEEDEVGRLSRLSSQSIRKSTKQWSLSSGYYTDDVEE